MTKIGPLAYLTPPSVHGFCYERGLPPIRHRRGDSIADADRIWTTTC